MSQPKLHRAHRRHNEKGSALLLTTVSMVTLIGFMGLGIDVGSVYRHRRVMRTAADAGALAGASEIYRAKTSLISSSALAATATNQFTNGTNGVTVNVHHPPITGFYTGDSRFVEVVIEQPSPTYFMQIFGWDTVPVPARAVAGVGANGRNCVYVLDPSMPGSFQGNSTALMDANCGIIVNSNNPNAMSMSGSADVVATSVNITGNYQISGGASITPTPNVGVPPEPDPLAYLVPPTYGACTQTNFHVVSGSTTVGPGVYCKGIKINSGAQVTLTPGLYVIVGGGIDVESSGVLEGNDVTFFLTEGTGNPFGTVSFQSDSQVRLRAPTSGPWAGILFYQDPNAGNPNTSHIMESSSNSYFEGALYFPTHQLKIQSSVTLDAHYTLVVARALSMQSGANFTVRSDYSSLAGGSPIKRISLVE